MSIPLRFAIVITGCLIIGAWAGYGLLAYAPCYWFEATRKIGCGFRSLGVAVILGLVVASIAFVASLRVAMAHAPVFRSPVVGKAPAILVAIWVALFSLNLLAAAAVPLSHAWTYEAYKFAAFILLPALVLASAFLAPYRGYPPAMALVAFVPVAGALVVGILLLLSRSTATRFRNSAK